jgi:outer membrane receptor protein involved in Fe transport
MQLRFSPSGTRVNRIRCLSLTVILTASAFAYAQTVVTGVVRDTSGAAIPNANVTAAFPGGSRSALSAPDGRFSLSATSSTGTLTIQARGFRDYSRSWNAAESVPLVVVLEPLSVRQEIVVTATRMPLSIDDNASSVAVLNRRDVAQSGAVTLDDVLRQVVGFSVFRRSSSLTANPTSQGVSLRGVGSSGASRALVLLDGVPINDPFGGWVYWDQLPQLALGSVEVLRGGASGLYGTDALGGVVNLISRSPQNTFAEIDGYAGNTFLRSGSALAGTSVGRWRALGSVQALDTDGFYVVPFGQRGQIDTRAAVRFQTGSARLERQFSSGRIFIAGNLLAEERNNGTQLQVNDTHLGRLALGADFAAAKAGSFSVEFYGTGERFHQSFSAIAAGRNSETLSRLQQVPSQQVGGSILWRRTFAAHNVVAGFEANQRRGHTQETIFVSGLPSSFVDAGGHTRNYGYFVEDVFTATPRLLLSASLRGDNWVNANGTSRTTPLQGANPPTFSSFPNRSEAAFSPRVSALYRLTGNLALTAAAYRSFRTPTLNELYRAFRLGNILTLANPDLTAEHLSGGEAGVRITSGPVVVRAVYFYNQITHPVTNLTLQTTPSLITRQRVNLGATRSQGLEVEADWRLSRLMLSAGYGLTNAVVTSSPATPGIVGNWVPQIPRHQFTFQAQYLLPKWTFALQARASGTQFDDDQNLLPLDPFFNLDASIARHLSSNIDLRLAGENILNQRAQVGRTPTVTIGPPALIRAEVLLHFGKR